MVEDIAYSAHAAVVDCDIGGERALLHLETNTYFTLNATATQVWLALREPKRLSDLVAVITEAFDATEAQCKPDIEALLTDMIAARVIEKDAQPETV